MKRKVATKAEKTQPVSAKPTTHLTTFIFYQQFGKPSDIVNLLLNLETYMTTLGGNLLDENDYILY